MSELARTTGRGFLVITGAKVWFLLTSAFVSLGLPLFFDRYGEQGTAAFGDYGVVINLVSILNMVMITGTIQAVSKVISEVPSRSRQFLWRAVTVQLFLGLPITLAYFLAAPLLARTLHDVNLAPFLRLTAGIVLFYSFYAIFVGYFNGRKEFVRQASLDIGFATIKAILIITAVFLGMGVAGAIGGFLATAVFMTGVSIVWVWRRERHQTPVDDPPGVGLEHSGSLRRILGYMVALMAYTFFLNLIIRADLFFLKSIAAYRYEGLDYPRDQVSLLSSSLSGIYTAMANLARLPYQAVISITFVIFPIISRSTFEGDREATRTYIRQTLRYSFILICSMAFVLAVFRSELVEALYPADYAGGADALIWLSLGMVAFSLTFVGTTILNSAGHPMQSLAVVGATLVLAAGLNGLFLLTFQPSPGSASVLEMAGSLGGMFLSPVESAEPMLARAALATLLATAGGMVAALWLIYRQYRATPPALTLLRIALAGMALVGAALLARHIPQAVWTMLCSVMLVAVLVGPFVLKFRQSPRRMALFAIPAALFAIAGLALAVLTIDAESRLASMSILVGKMAFFGILFYALLYLLREFDEVDMGRLKSVLGSRRSASREV